MCGPVPRLPQIRLPFHRIFSASRAMSFSAEVLRQSGRYIFCDRPPAMAGRAARAANSALVAPK